MSNAQARRGRFTPLSTLSHPGPGSFPLQARRAREAPGDEGHHSEAPRGAQRPADCPHLSAHRTLSRPPRPHARSSRQNRSRRATRTGARGPRGREWRQGGAPQLAAGDVYFTSLGVGLPRESSLQRHLDDNDDDDDAPRPWPSLHLGSERQRLLHPFLPQLLLCGPARPVLMAGTMQALNVQRMVSLTAY